MNEDDVFQNSEPVSEVPTEENFEESSELNSEETSDQETSEENSEENSEDTSEETSEDTYSTELLENINNNLESVNGFMYVGLGFIIFFFLTWLILKIEKMLETYF